MRLERGLTLVELMVALVVSALILVAVASTFIATRASFRTQDDAAAAQENASFATAVIGRMIRQGGYSFLHLNSTTNLPYEGRCRVRDGEILTGSITVAKHGWRITAKRDTAALAYRPPGSAAPSDEITLLFCGAHDGGTVDCLGNAVARDEVHSARLRIEVLAGVNGAVPVLDANGAPQIGLVCYSRQIAPSPTAEQRAVVAVGIEAVRYAFGVDRNDDGFVREWLSAADIDAASVATPLWGKIRAVKISFVTRGNNLSLGTPDTRELWHFGPTDPNGSKQSVSAQPATEQLRPRKVFQSTLTLRNMGDSI